MSCRSASCGYAPKNDIYPKPFRGWDNLEKVHWPSESWLLKTGEILLTVWD
jgi:hypothetical protein